MPRFQRDQMGHDVRLHRSAMESILRAAVHEDMMFVDTSNDTIPAKQPLVVITLLAILVSSNAWGQSVTGAIFGTISDATGSVVSAPLSVPRTR
jgi:hypothetical protein